MRKETNINKKRNAKKFTAALISAVIFLAIGMLYYNLSKNENEKVYTDKISKINNQSENYTIKNNTDTEEASVNLGKSVEESEEENEKIAINTSLMEDKKEESKNEIPKKTEKSETEENEVKEKEELVFSMPVDGETIKEFAKDTLLYSTTLNEWTTHLGIDIKAEKTTVVKASEKGKVKSIKNDPRYGLTIVIEHVEGYCTVYANLLTSEFVVEGEEVSKGQTIGTVGNTAVFEVADESHLHFEILKNNVQVDPNVYLK